MLDKELSKQIAQTWEALRDADISVVDSIVKDGHTHISYNIGDFFIALYFNDYDCKNVKHGHCHRTAVMAECKSVKSDATFYIEHDPRAEIFRFQYTKNGKRVKLCQDLKEGEVFLNFLKFANNKFEDIGLKINYDVYKNTKEIMLIKQNTDDVFSARTPVTNMCVILGKNGEVISKKLNGHSSIKNLKQCEMAGLKYFEPKHILHEFFSSQPKNEQVARCLVGTYENAVLEVLTKAERLVFAPSLKFHLGAVAKDIGATGGGVLRGGGTHRI